MEQGEEGKNILACFILNQYVSIGRKICSSDKEILNTSISDRIQFLYVQTKP